MNEEQRNGKKLIAGLLCLLILALYAGGVLRQFMVDAGHISLNPIRCLYFAVSSIHGIKTTVFTILLFFAFAGIVVFQGSISDTGGEDKERNFTYSKLGTYGTAGYMEDAERRRVLKEDKDIRKVEGIIFGLEMMSGNVLSLPVDSKLNRNIAVCGSQGSMKSRAFARNMILQCVRRGESMFITDPKSELYEDMVAYLKAQRYTVRQWNLIDLENSDAWDCLAEIDEGGLIDIFADVVIRNTTDKFDHFYDNVEMDLLKALCLYVYHEYKDKDRTFAESYKILINQSLEAIDGIFDRLPTSHPAKGPYRLFAKAEKVKGNAVLGLGTRLQIMQNEKVQKITSHKEIDLTLPGREKCAYFCITFDQDSTYDVLATLFVSFLCIKLIRYADRQKNRKLPVPVHFILDEFPNIGIVPDFKKKLATARGRNIGMSIIYQNIPQLQNRYPDGQWEEILGGCDMSLFLGCNDMTTAMYFSNRSGEVTVSVSSVRKNLNTVRMSNYVPDYSETSSVGKRMLLLPDEILRFPLDQALVIIRGQRILRVRKMDYTMHPDAKKLIQEKTDCHVPEWRQKEELGTEEDIKVYQKDIGEQESGLEPEIWPEGNSKKDDKPQEDGKSKVNDQNIQKELGEQELERVEKVEDLFTDEW
ncbi:type IV secretory system conjugative DNA transfer family protein [[Clostridium] symbiosum]|uniref:VirD4-like conjugal transfer protein, CD1115 family n=1 Tax=Clostridium symbiosum TaxID=1512 RepID=UPI0032BFF621